MKLFVHNSEITLHDGFSIEIEIKNPFFSDEGSASLPISIPATPENLAVLGHPQRLGRSRALTRSIPATIQHKTFILDGNLVIGSVSDKEISCTFTIKETLVYTESKDKKLKDLFVGERLFPDAPGIDTLAEQLWDLYQGNQVSSLPEGIIIFPVMVTEDDYGFNMLNMPNSENTGFVYRQRELTHKEDQNKKMEVPSGYGMTPFILLWKMVEKAFELAGYSISENAFAKEPYSSIVVLNNCADTLCIDCTYADLVPSITVGELIIWMRDKFAAVTSFDGSEVKVRLMTDILSQEAQDISSYLRKSSISVDYPAPRHLSLEMKTELEGAQPAADSLEAFASAHVSPIIISCVDFENIEEEGLFQIRETGEFYSFFNGEKKRLGTDFFNYIRDIDAEIESHKTDDTFPPAIVYEHTSAGISLCPFIGPPIHNNTSVSEDDEDKEQGIAICWALRKNSLPITSPATFKGPWFGSTRPYGIAEELPIVTNDGSRIPSLSPEAIHDRFWSTYENIILNGNPVVQAQIDWPVALLMQIDPLTPFSIYGQMYLLQEMKYSISSNGITSGFSKLLRMSSYRDATYPPVVSYLNELEWEARTDWPDIWNPEKVSEMKSDGLAPYTPADKPIARPLYAGQIAKKRKRSVTVRWGDGGAVSLGWKYTYYEYFIAIKVN